MNTPLGNIQAFDANAGFSSTSVDSIPRGLKRSASTPNVSASLFERRTRPQLGSDEKKIIAGFVNTPVMVVKTPLAKIISRGSPLQKGTPLSASLQLLPSESELPPSYVRETSSLELLETSTFDIEGKSELVSNQVETTEPEQSESGKYEPEQSGTDKSETSRLQDEVIETEIDTGEKCVMQESNEDKRKEQIPSNQAVEEIKNDAASQQIPQSPIIPQPVISLSLSPQLPRPQSSLSATLQEADLVLRQLAQKRAASEQAEYAAFQQSLRAKARAEQERIEALAAANAKRLQKLKAGPNVLPAKSIKPLTTPSEFRFEYESRMQLKKLAKPAPRQDDKENDHSGLRRVKSFSSLPSIGKSK